MKLGIGGLATLPALSCSGGSLGQYPNVLLISLDTLRADHLGCYGYGRPTTPNIDMLAETGVVFENCTSQSNNTVVSHTSMLTSLYPETHRVLTNQNTRLSEKAITLADILRNKGYTTAATVAFDALREHGLNKGFRFFWAPDPARFDLGVTSAEMVWKDVVRKFTYIQVRLLFSGYLPFFLFVHYYDPHSDWDRLPYDSPMPYLNMYCKDYQGNFTGGDGDLWASRYLRKIHDENISLTEEELEYIVALYDGGITYTDEYVGRLLKHLRGLGLLDNTLIVLTSDHGEEFKDHGGMLHERIFQEHLHVPLIVKFPGNRHGGKVVSERVRTIDIAPTILDILDIRYEKMQGESFLNLIEGGGLTEDRITFSGEPSQYSVITSEGFKFIHNSREGKAKEVYDLKVDPRESENLYDSQPEKAGQLEKLIAQWREENQRLSVDLLGPLSDVDAVEITPEKRDQLRALGYLR